MTGVGNWWQRHHDGTSREPTPQPEPLPEAPPPVRTPLRVSPDRRRILDAAGNPLLLQGDAAWSLIANMTLDDARRYLEDRRRKGFNVVIVNLIERLFSQDPPRNLAGDEPFTTPGDFRTPNEAYMAHAERVLDIAADLGILVILAPAYLGYPPPANADASRQPEGWYDEVVANGAEGGRAWGDYLGRRFGRFANIIWCIGGDRNPEAALAGLDQIARGIRAAGGDNLFTAHVLPEHSPLDVFPDRDWLDLNPTYTYDIVHGKLQRDWQRDPVWPFYLIESIYEGEHNASDQQIRRQAYWSVLCGGNGHCMGNAPIWWFGPGWESALEMPASVAMARWGAFFRNLPWADLVPDFDHAIVTGGLGEARGLDRVTTAATPDRRLAVAYLPAPRPVTVEVGALAGPTVRVGWFEPATGRRLSGGALVAAGAATLAPPFAEDA
ncbi:MAG TPA: DUF4038 domain-containing protein, partial [Thermomicrobiales bacterium]|nr:DUF4038 domain-containing protein [Thermomicrobiales bacterium]